MSIIEKLENWVETDKGRFVEINIDTGYGATCWNVILGNVDIEVKDNWQPYSLPHGKEVGAVFSAEAEFVRDLDNPIPENIVYVDQDLENGWPGLELTIKKGLERVQELGL